MPLTRSTRPDRSVRASSRPVATVLAVAIALDLLLVGLYLGWGALSLPAPMPAATHAGGVVFFRSFGPLEGLDRESMARVEHAAALFRAAKVRQLVCVGGRRQQRPETGAGLMAAALIRRGVPTDHVQHDTTSFDTIGNWRSARALLGDTAQEDPLLISDPLHLLRIRHITGGTGTPAPTTTIAQTLRERGWGLVIDVHREWIAWAAAVLLPAELHQRWIRQWRNFWDRSPSPPPRAHSVINRNAHPSSAAAP